MSILKVVCLGVAIAVALPTAGPSQDLAALAKKEKQRQAKARAEGSEGKVYTGSGSPATAEPLASPDSSAPTSTDAKPRNRTVASPSPTGKSSARSYRTVNVTLYVTSWCGYCRKARAFLATQPNVNVVVHDIEENKARHREMLAKSDGETGVPVIDVEGIVLKGFSATKITDALAMIRSR